MAQKFGPTVSHETPTFVFSKKKSSFFVFLFFCFFGSFFHQRGNNTPPKDFNVPKNWNVLWFQFIEQFQFIEHGRIFITQAKNENLMHQHFFGYIYLDGSPTVRQNPFLTRSRGQHSSIASRRIPLINCSAALEITCLGANFLTHFRLP